MVTFVKYDRKSNDDSTVGKLYIYQYFKRHNSRSSSGFTEWFFIFCWLDPLLQDPVLLFCYGGPCKVYCFLTFVNLFSLLNNHGFCLRATLVSL